jgi:hypothetical protein
MSYSFGTSEPSAGTFITCVLLHICSVFQNNKQNGMNHNKKSTRICKQEAKNITLLVHEHQDISEPLQ